MSEVYMSKVTIDGYSERVDDVGYEYSESKDSAGNGNSIMLPTSIRAGVAITLQITAGEGKVQVTTSSIAEVIAGTAVWVDWDAGSVTETTQDFMLPSTALRLVNTSGTTKIILRAQ